MLLELLYYFLLFCTFITVLLIGLNISMLALGDVFGVVAWIVLVGFLLASLYDDCEDY